MLVPRTKDAADADQSLMDACISSKAGVATTGAGRQHRVGNEHALQTAGDGFTALPS
jgi:hypothetical protein